MPVSEEPAEESQFIIRKWNPWTIDGARDRDEE